ncbi:RNA-binding domain-containing protein [Arcobacter sp. CECT 9188]|uniref:RNA-binding domain-containing protein n=1 Tax=Arcobacter sp. CECT 9188 TaxID=2044505 RepID=UPI000DEA7BA1|nr:RNA-binding domain-containing protein [Arcobacter sp. CECT 9188]RBQ26596.1 transcriptional regulator [Arcobacter sp. CECT 9188]
MTNLLLLEESNRIELKEKLTDNLEKEVVAFLNHKDGGVIYICINSKKEIVELENIDDIQLKIKDRLKHNILPSCMGLFEVVLETIFNKKIIKIVVASGREKPYHLRKYGMSSKGCFIRIGSSSEPMEQNTIEEMFAKRVRNSIGNIKSRRQDLTFEQLRIFYQEKGFVLNDKFASNLEILTQDGEFNYVAYLLADINGTSIKVAKYAGLDKRDLIENVEFGYCSLIRSTQKVLDKLDVENQIFTTITHKERVEKPLWNKVALREAVINAIVHDYTTEYPPVFEIYQDRIEITSSGGLSTIKNIYDFFGGYSKPINRELMRVFKDLELVEHLGSGMNRILPIYGKDSFVISNNFMKNIFYKADVGVNEIYEYIKKYQPIKANEIAQNFSEVTQRTIERWLKELRDDNKIEFIGATKTGGYFVK